MLLIPKQVAQLLVDIAWLIIFKFEVKEIRKDLKDSTKKYIDLHDQVMKSDLTREEKNDILQKESIRHNAVINKLRDK
jgi:hypothetical protein